MWSSWSLGRVLHVRTKSKGSGVTDAWSTSAGVPSGLLITLAFELCERKLVLYWNALLVSPRRRTWAVPRLLRMLWDNSRLSLLPNTHRTHMSAVLSSKSSPATAALDPSSSRHKEVLRHYQPIVKRAADNCWWYSSRSDLQRIMAITLIPPRVVRSDSLTIILLISLRQLPHLSMFGVKFDSNHGLDLIIPFGSIHFSFLLSLKWLSALAV